MFESTTPFEQSSRGQFGSPSVFGQNSNVSRNPFTSKPIGSTPAFGLPTGGSIFGGTSTDVFGANSSPLHQHQPSTFGSPFSPSFGTSTVVFGGSSTPVFSSSSSSAGG
ncbi:hypothetical protein U1Q18_002789 [Sarracenia purpurea var. burkii]